MKRIFFLSFPLFVSMGLFAQTNDQIFLKWKLRPNEVLTYKTSMNEIIDTSNYIPMYTNFGDKDSVGSKLFEELDKESKKLTLITKLTEQKKDIINIEMTAVKKDSSQDKPNDSNDSIKNKMRQAIKSFTEGVQLSGSVN